MSEEKGGLKADGRGKRAESGAEAPVVPKKSQKETEAQKTAFELYYNMGRKEILRGCS